MTHPNSGAGWCEPLWYAPQRRAPAADTARSWSPNAGVVALPRTHESPRARLPRLQATNASPVTAKRRSGTVGAFVASGWWAPAKPCRPYATTQRPRRPQTGTAVTNNRGHAKIDYGCCAQSSSASASPQNQRIRGIALGSFLDRALESRPVLFVLVPCQPLEEPRLLRILRGGRGGRHLSLAML